MKPPYSFQHLLEPSRPAPMQTLRWRALGGAPTRQMPPLGLWQGLAYLVLSLAWAPSLQAAPPSYDTLRSRLTALENAQDQSRIAPGTLTSVAYQLELLESLGPRYKQASTTRLARIERVLNTLEQGRDPYQEAAGTIRLRGYHSVVSDHLQGYAIYLPPDYDPQRSYPLMVMLHGGSANGNLFLGVVLGNNLSWKRYREHLWDTFTPRWTPDWIIVAPDGFGHVMWRFMGEQDVLDVLQDVQAHYPIDPNRVVLGGLSNGGVGAYHIGMRHASRFAAVMAIAGAPSWSQYAGAPATAAVSRLLAPLNGLALAPNTANTDFRYYHGRKDGGPMKPRYVQAFSKRLQDLGIPDQGQWFDAGHDILYLAHQRGKVYETLASVRREPRPAAVRLVTADYRAARQAWLEVTSISDYPNLAEASGRWAHNALTLHCSRVRGLRIHTNRAPLSPGTVQVTINGQQAYSGPVPSSGYLDLIATTRGFTTGQANTDSPELHKRPGLSGPITDAYFDRMVHVYGTQNPKARARLEALAKQGSHGWPLWLKRVQQPVIPDTAVTDELMHTHHLVLYGRPGDNLILDRIQDKLPIRVDGSEIELGTARLSGRGIGAKFIYPNPLANERYVIVQTGPTLAGVAGGQRLPDFLPDYVVYDEHTTRTRPRLLFNRKRGQPVRHGFFDDAWQLKPSGNDTDAATTPAGQPPPPPKAPHSTAPAQAPTAPSGLRARANHGHWTLAPEHAWSPRPSPQCLADLQRQHIPAYPYEGPPLGTHVHTPVELQGPVEGVWFRSTHADRAIVLACELATRLPQLTRVLKRHGVRAVDVLSSYRARPLKSFHTQGLALDLLRFIRLDGALSVLHDFQATPQRPTCTGPAPSTESARTLRAIACELAASQHFSTVLTPNYNRGHRDHFHIDARPDDPRIYTR